MDVIIKKKIFFGELRIVLKCPLCRQIILLDDKTRKREQDKNINCFKCCTTYSIIGIKNNTYQLIGSLNENNKNNS